VSLAKLAHIAAVLPGVALWSFGALMFLVAAAAASFDAHELWARADAVTRQRQSRHAGTVVAGAAR